MNVDATTDVTVTVSVPLGVIVSDTVPVRGGDSSRIVSTAAGVFGAAADDSVSAKAEKAETCRNQATRMRARTAVLPAIVILHCFVPVTRLS